MECNVPPRDDYEAWELTFTGGRKVVCLPVGKSATLEPRVTGTYGVPTP
ncbi:DUF6188 family protein [Streptomyces globosus]